jgi:hypothetical protein
MDGIARGREDEFSAQLARGEIVALLEITHLMGASDSQTPSIATSPAKG